jgi:hypothetical protein
MTLKKALLVIAILILLYLVVPAVHVNSTDAGGLPSSTPAAPSTVLQPETTTTPTTIDLSFLNTTTTSTTVPKQPQNKVSNAPVPEYRNDSADRWDQLAQCETGGNWSANTGNGFGGGLQFMHQRSYSTWLSFGGDEYAAHPWEASREQQIVIAEKVLASSGWKAWPGCSRKFGWR